MNKTIYNCTQCGKSFERWPSQRKRGKHFCSYKCKVKEQTGKHHGGNTENCIICKKMFFIKPYAVKHGRKCCSGICKNVYFKTLTGEKSRHWKGGVQKAINGYLEQPITQTSGRAIRILQHRRIMMDIVGENLMPTASPNIVVHHRDGNKKNNHPSNLEVMTRSDHARLHALQNGLGRHLRKEKTI